MEITYLPPYDELIEHRIEYSTRNWSIDEHVIRFEGCYVQNYYCIMPLDCNGCVLAHFYFRSVYLALGFASNFQGFHTAEFWRKKVHDDNTEHHVLEILYGCKLRLPSWELR